MPVATYEALLEMAASDEHERIIKLLQAECDCDFFEKYEIPSRCYAHKYIAFIKGEK
jgi:hypothetical protein